MENLQKAFGENLKFYRKKAGYTQKQLAEELGYTEKAVSKWESGGAIPPAETLVNLALLLQTSVDGLLSFSPEPCYFLGIDGGATKTLFALCDRGGNLLRTVCLGPCNPVDLGFEKAEAVLGEGIRAVCTHIPCSEISVFAGISGGNVGCNQQIFTEFFKRFRFAKIAVENDAVNIVAAGLGDRDGIAVIMGTGCVAFTQKGGRLRQYGGFGYLFDNGGDGYNLGRDAIHAALYDEAGGGKPTAITALVQKMLGTPVADGLTELYAKGKRYIASFAPTVTEAYSRGDTVAAEILRKNMGEVAHLIDTAARDFEDTCGQIPVVCVGGLTKSFSVLRPMLEQQLREKDRVDISVYPHEPVLGALLRAGATIDTNKDNGIRR